MAYPVALGVERRTFYVLLYRLLQLLLIYYLKLNSRLISIDTFYRYCSLWP